MNGCKVTTNTSGAVRVRWCLAQGHLARWSPGIEPATFLLPDNTTDAQKVKVKKRDWFSAGLRKNPAE